MYFLQLVQKVRIVSCYFIFVVDIHSTQLEDISQNSFPFRFISQLKIPFDKNWYFVAYGSTYELKVFSRHILLLPHIAYFAFSQNFIILSEERK
jgi:hypothetical protein